MNCLSFNKENRLLKRADFVACYEQGRRYHSRHFLLFVKRDSETAVWQAGMAVSRKNGKAVSRNRIKRVLREFFRLHQELIPPAVKIVAVPKRHLDAGELNLNMLETELLPILNELSGKSAPCRVEAASYKVSV